jgi:hypothetical protein
VWLRRKHHPRADNLIEHPHRDLPVVSIVVIIELAAENGTPALLPTAYDDLQSVQRVPWIVNLLDFGLMITLVRICTTTNTTTVPSDS